MVLFHKLKYFLEQYCKSFSHARVCVGKVLFKQNPLANRYKGDITKQDYFTMSRIVFKPPFDENKSFDKVAGVADNTATTKHISAQPSRHTLAIFMPNATHALSVFITSLLDTCISKLSAVYGGLIGVNTRPKGNSPSRICAVVETCHPIWGGALLTKHIGVFTVNTKHTPQPTKGNPTNTPLFAFTGKIKPTQARKSSNKNPQQFDNFLVYVPSLKITVYFDKYFDAFAHASYLKSLYPLTNIGIYGYQSLIDTQSGEQGGNHD